MCDRIAAARSCSLSSLVCPFTPFLLKKRLLDFTVNAQQPLLRSSGTFTKVIGLGLKLVRSLLSIAQLNSLPRRRLPT
jgi:hypothetical protein